MKRLILCLGLAGSLIVPATVLAVPPLGVVRDTQTAHVVAEAQIARLPFIYAWSVDSLDIDTLMTVFSEDIEYDLSAYGFPSVKGWDNVKAFFLSSVFPANECSFIMIANIWSEVTGNKAIGGDYYKHAGIRPVTDPPLPPDTVRHTQGRHIYRFKKEHGEWKISYLKGELFMQWKETISPPYVSPPFGIGCPMPPAR
ncbi:MAG: nuclear transport factor 2 family protein [Candidatus Binatia bacterium]